MAIYWMTEAIPMAATALIPFALMPWLGILEASEIAGNYLTVIFWILFERKKICPNSVTRIKCGVRSTLCWKIGNISDSTELFGL